MEQYVIGEYNVYLYLRKGEKLVVAALGPELCLTEAATLIGWVDPDYLVISTIGMDNVGHRFFYHRKGAS